ncbi:MAG: lipoprotein [Proteobacteria bacterium]|nr:lipoprotein [Pseudomonadota bacterium]
MRTLTRALILSVLLSACGTKGPLYLPPPVVPVPAQSEPAAPSVKPGEATDVSTAPIPTSVPPAKAPAS